MPHCDNIKIKQKFHLINILRSQPPLAHVGWDRIWDATDWKQVCPQLDYRGRPIGSENCLFLNVFTPGIKKGVTFPVLVFLHGGNFDSGSGNLFGPQALVDQNIVVVTLNYRLGMLGFAATEDDALPGNLGLRDQLLALRWVRDNIAVFGGQPDRVTLQGQGSGAVCVLLHVVSPRSRGLFHRAIVQSGTPLSEPSLHISAREAAQSAALSLGCPAVASTHDVRDCLSNAPLTDLLRMQQEGKILGDYPMRFTPRVDRESRDAMLPANPAALLASGNFAKVPIIIGYNKDETAVLYPELLALLRSELGDDQDYVRNILLPKFFRTALNIRDPLKDVLDDVYDHYFSGINYKDHDGIIQAFVNMSTSALFAVPIFETAVLLARSSPSTFIYSFSYRGDISMLDSKLGPSASRKVNLGPAHGDELLYLFQVVGSGLRPSTNLVDGMVSRRMIRMWSDFARAGVPVLLPDPEYLPWPSSSPSNVTIYQLGRSLKPHLVETQEAEAVSLWRSVLPRMADIGKQGSLNTEQVALSGQTLVDPVYRTLAYSMVTVALALLAAVAVLLAILYRQTRSSSFICGRATPEASSRSSPDNSYNIY
ncbi:esterase FE4-like [Tropilaelaps mercedesae]|uniref:Esterase FE4-like n=1 Tax=Tropilaelaps mercedesae TaxID=418985 RepID=A0A1V9Y1L6_9ACAR|nr:esterase FE4-like [Tropilaelaps mercedesae]